LGIHTQKKDIKYFSFIEKKKRIDTEWGKRNRTQIQKGDKKMDVKKRVNM
jgi:hypothetical protein